MEGVHVAKTVGCRDRDGQRLQDPFPKEQIDLHLTRGFEFHSDVGNILKQLKSRLIQPEEEVFLQKEMKELHDVNRQLQDLNRHYLEMIGFVTHEFMQPLSVLKAFLSMLHDESIGALTDPRQRKAVDAMMRSVHSLVHMTQKYLQLARIESGRMEAEPSWIRPFQECLAPILEDEKRHLEIRGVEIVLENEAAFRQAEIWADPILLRVVFGNLISNAVKYGRRGGKVYCGFKEDGPEPLFYVKNEGQGIPKKDLEKVFEKFSRLEGELARARTGTGLGLYSVQQIIRKHGGRSWAESMEGEWANILFTIPKKEKAI
jgi:signal transduction histidine kinase